MNEVDGFLGRFHITKDVDTVFTSEAHFWFAYILYRRFIRNGAILMYSNEDNYFGTKICGKVYDITGDVTKKYNWKPWLELEDENKREQIVRDYIMF